MKLASEGQLRGISPGNSKFDSGEHDLLVILFGKSTIAKIDLKSFRINQFRQSKDWRLSFTKSDDQFDLKITGKSGVVWRVNCEKKSFLYSF